MILFRFLAIAVTVLGLVVGAAILLAPVDNLRAPMELVVREATGRSFQIHGPVSLTWSSGLALDLGAVTLGDLPGTGNAAMVNASRAVLEVKALPLLGGEVEPTALVLENAEIHLARDEAGNGNWQIGTSARDPFQILGFGDVRLVNVSLVAVPGSIAPVTVLFNDARLRWPRDTDRLALDGMISFRGETFDTGAVIERPSTLFTGAGVPVQGTFESDLASGDFDGDMNLGALTYDGSLAISAPSVRRLAAFFGGALPGQKGAGEASLSASVHLTSTELQARNAKLSLDDMIASGDLGIRLTGPRLSIAGTLNIDSFDLATFLALPPATAPGWSDTPLDLSGLQAFDLNADLTIGQAVVAGIHMNDAHAIVSIGGGKVLADIPKALVYGGLGRGRLAIDASVPVTAYTLSLSLPGMDGASFFRDALASDLLAGRTSITADLAASGATRREIVSTLTGSATLDVDGGVLSGADFVAIAHTLLERDQTNATAEDSTTITRLEAAAHVTKGTATLKSLMIKTPASQWQGEGGFGLAQRSLRLQLHTMPQAPWLMPFAVTGGWGMPNYLADWQALADAIKAKVVPPETLQALPEERRQWFEIHLKSGTALPQIPQVTGVGTGFNFPFIVP